jgi:NADH-quinone oxidoreductase subunit L
MEGYSYIIWILILPLLTFLVTGLGSRKISPTLAGIIGTTSMGICALLSIYTAWSYFGYYSNGVYPSLKVIDLPWLSFTENLSIHLGMVLDPISVMMLVVVTLVSFMVHLYSIGYLHGESRGGVYFSYLSLFSFSMLGLVVSTNLFQMYIFWELVGVSSFLLIGYYFTKPSAVAASKKAFIVTRFADFGFLVGILIMGYVGGSFEFDAIISRLTNPESPEFLTATGAGFLGISLLTWSLVLIFMGGAGKSAMFPLHIWLPDAMEGPTPVSALIHAATMVVAGVFLVARLFPVFFQVPVALDLVAWVGALSALFAAIIACTQTDIKRILAYSTMSQIGYMMFGLGVSGMGEAGLGYMGSMFHLFTHAMFKALLFLGAGAVIHYVHSNEVSDMGALRKKMPVTGLLFLLACLSISGIPPFSGFFSKEEILTAAHMKNPVVYGIGLFTAGLTAFYMFRLYYLIFWHNKPYHDKPSPLPRKKEAPLTMMVPMILLGFATLVSGFFPFNNFVTSDGKPLEITFHADLSAIAIGVSLTGIALASVFYLRPGPWPDKIATALGGFFTTVYRKFYIDEIYTLVAKKFIIGTVSPVANWFDRNVVDGLMNFTGTVMGVFSDSIKVWQSGKIHGYLLWFFAGSMIVLILMFIL